jgi:5-methyltetrahydrofolate--homocysteine methyltransferase
LDIPACLDVEDQTKLFAILHPEEIAATLTDTFQIEPEQSTSAIVVHHAAARYFVA